MVSNGKLTTRGRGAEQKKGSTGPDKGEWAGGLRVEVIAKTFIKERKRPLALGREHAGNRGCEFLTRCHTVLILPLVLLFVITFPRLAHWSGGFIFARSSTVGKHLFFLIVGKFSILQKW